MNYAEFHQHFGGSARSHNIAARGVTLPETSGLPKEFIRLDPWEIEYLFNVAQKARQGILEIGRLRGGSLFMLACAADDVPIWSIDIAPQDDGELLTYLNHPRIHLIVGDSHKVDTSQVGKVDLLFIDGDHSYEGVRGDLAHWYSKVAPGGHIVLHDCCLKEVQQAALEFYARHQDEMSIVIYPAEVPNYENCWRTPTGSLGHFVRHA